MAATAQRLFGPPRHQAPKESEFLRVLEISRFLGEKGVAERFDFPGSICSKGPGWEPIRCSNLLRKRFRFLVADHKTLIAICRNIRGKLDFLMRIAALACWFVGASLARAAGQSIFVPSPPVSSISTKTQGSPSSSVDLNQAAM